MNLHGYITTVFTASVLGAVCAAVAGSAFEKYVRYLASLICILAVIYPFRDFTLPDWETEGTEASDVQNGATLDSLASDLAEEELCSMIASSLCAETGITASEVRIDIDWTAEEPTVSAVELVLPPEEADAADRACAMIENTYGVPCRIAEEGGAP